MTFNELVTEIITIRFNDSMRTRIKRWMNVVEQKLWDAEDWPFKFVTDQPLAVQNGVQTIDTSTIDDFNRPMSVLNQDGVKLVYLSNNEWDTYYADDLSTGDAQHFTMVNRMIYLGPTPDSDETFSCRYERVYAHFNDLNAVTPGLMSLDDDYPLWDAAYHMALIPGTLSLLLRLHNDPTWEPLEMEFQEELQRMRAHYMPPRIGTRSYAGTEGRTWHGV